MTNDWSFESFVISSHLLNTVFSSFLEKLGKGKGYVPVEDPSQVNNPDQMFKIFEGKAFNEEIHTLADTSDILRLLSGRKSLELE